VSPPSPNWRAEREQKSKREGENLMKWLKSEKMPKMNTKRLCLTLLFANASVRLLFLRQISNPYEITLAFTSVLMLLGALMTFVLSDRKARLIAAVVLGVTLALEMGIGLKPFLTASLSSLAVIAIYTRKNGKSVKKELLVGLFILLLMLPLSNVRLAKASVI